jgi:mRNA degradation ribonuclease J1/J2
VSAAKEAKPVALICEGTRITDMPTEESEQRVFREAGGLVEKHPNAPVFADFNFKEMDRVRTSTAKVNGRKLVVKLKDCYYLKYMSQDPSLAIPSYDDKDIIIYKPNRVSSGRRLLRRGRDLCQFA